MNILTQLLHFLLRRKRKVWLVMHDGDLVVADAVLTDAGWCARWINNNDQWSVLLPDGTTNGTKLVKRWLPHTGWNEPTLVHRPVAQAKGETLAQEEPQHG